MKVHVDGSLYKDIKDEWFERTGAVGYRPTSPSYRAHPDPKVADYPVAIIPFDQIVPPRRDDGYLWFVEHRMVRILAGVVAGESLPAIYVHVPPGAPTETPYVLLDGVHRFYASKALGFTHVPASVLPYVEPFVDI